MIRRASQRGFSIVTTIFLVVVLAALGAFMVTISGSQHYATLNAVSGARAYFAGRSGIEWAIDRALTGNCAAANTTLTLPLYADYDVTLTCTPSAHTEGAASYNVYLITALAKPKNLNLDQPGYASRRLRVTIADV